MARDASPSLRARQRANLAAMRARVKAILKRTAEGHAYFDALIAGKPAKKPTIPSSSTKSRSTVTVAPYSTTMHGSASSTRAQVEPPAPSPVQIDIPQRLFDKLKRLAQRIGMPIDEVVERIIVESLPPPPPSHP